MKSNRFLLPILVILLAIILTSCDGYFSADGVVYEWIDAPDGNNGEMYFNMEAPTNRIINPLSDVKIYFYGIAVTSDANGAFHDRGTVAPITYMMDIRVEKEGFVTLTGEFQNPIKSDHHHDIVIFMVKDK